MYLAMFVNFKELKQEKSSEFRQNRRVLRHRDNEYSPQIEDSVLVSH